MSYLESAQRLRPIIEVAMSLTDDAVALEAVSLSKRWTEGRQYAIADRVNYEGTLYRCVQSHTSQSDWSPPSTPALWVVVSLEAWPEWVQPTGAHDAYNIGDKITYNGSHYTSRINANVYSPSAYPAGWSLQNS